MCRAITFTVRSLKYVGLPFSLPLPCNISWCTVLYVPRLPSTYSLQSAPSPIIKARNSLTGCRILLFQFSFDIPPTLIMLLEILQTHCGLSVKICLLRGKRAFFVYLVRRTWAATYLQLAWKVSGSRILTQVSLQAVLNFGQLLWETGKSLAFVNKQFTPRSFRPVIWTLCCGWWWALTV